MKDEEQYEDEEFVDELQEEPEPDDTPYNEWERWPWGWPGM